MWIILSTSSFISLDGPWLVWGIWFIHIFLLLHYVADPWLILMWDLLYFHVVMIPWFMLWGIFIWCILFFEIPCCMLLGYFCCRCACVLLWHPFCALLVGCTPCMFLYHTDRSLLIESSSCRTFLRATPTWGPSSLYDRDIISCVHHFFWQHLMQWPTPPWLGPGDIVPPGWTPLTTAYVSMC